MMGVGRYGPFNFKCCYIMLILLEWTKLVCTPASTALFACPGGTDCVQVRYRHIRQAAIPARVVLGTAVFCHQSNQYLAYEFPFCAMHMRVSSVSLPYLQNRCVHHGGIRYGALSSQRSHSNAYAVLSPLAATLLMAQTQYIIVTCTGFHAFGTRSRVCGVAGSGEQNSTL